jgi:hypothetical protein
MYCDRCGAELREGAAFCSSCGKAVGAGPTTPPPPSRGRIAEHIRLLGILWMVASALWLLPGAILLAVGSGAAAFLPPEVPRFVLVLLPMLGGFFIVGAAIGIAAGWGLLERQPWARMLAIVLGILNLLHMPFGTALGIYTLWVLWPPESEREYNSMAHAT